MVPNAVTNLLPKTVGKAAEFYASQFGWRVFPLYEMTPAGVCSCKAGDQCRTPGKHPRVSIPSGEGAQHPATSDVEQIKKWWKKWPTANIGVWLEGSNIIVLDIDKNDKKDGFAGLADIMAAENQKSMPATLTCDTPSGGKHLYFNFTDGVPNKANSLGPGLDTWHSAHYVIVPPSNHVKGIYKWVDGPDKPVDYPAWLKPQARTHQTGTTPKRGRGRPAKERLDPKDPDDIERLSHALKFVDSTDRDIWVLVGFALARAFEWSDQGFDIYNAWAKGAHNYDEKKTREQYYKQSKTTPPTPITTASIFEWAKKHTNYQRWEKVDDRPFEIREHNGDSLATLTAMADLLPEFPIYQRSSKLVEIVPINQEGGYDDGSAWYPKGSYILREIQPTQLAARILPSKVKWLKRGMNGWRLTDVSVFHCSALLGIGNWPSAMKLRAFVQHPTIRDDGSLLIDRGYDKASGLFVTDRFDVKVDSKATKKDAAKSLKKLMYPFHEFKWIDGSVSQSALLSAILTVGVRHLFDEGVPLFAVDAPRQGSGKTKLIKAISNLWFGRPMAVTPYSSDPEEMKKHLASLLLAGDRVVLFDNVNSMVRVNDPTLNALLTSGRATFRELGTQRMLDLDTAATFFMTGNNLNIVGDMIRRTIKMQIDPEGLHPMDRTFKIDPLETWVLDHRVELISHALTIFIAFFNAGCPKPTGVAPLASFERWSEIIRNVVLWLGLDDVRESISQGYEQDDEASEIVHLINELTKITELHTNGLTSAMLLPIIENNKVLQEAMLPFVNMRSTGVVTGIHHPRMVTTVLSQVAKIDVEGKKLLRLGPVWKIREKE